MDAQQKELVQSSFTAVVPIAAQAADIFYDRLFELDPSLRPLFKDDMTEQKKNLIQMLAAAVKGLDDLDALVPVVRDLGARHIGYGVKDAHYDTVGEALLWTLGKGLGDAFTTETEAAWVAVYGVLSTTRRTRPGRPRRPGPEGVSRGCAAGRSAQPFAYARANCRAWFSRKSITRARVR